MFHQIWYALCITCDVLRVLVPALIAVRLAVAVARFAAAPSEGRRWYLPMLWAAWRWRFLARHADLAYVEQAHRRTLRPKVPGTTAVRVSPSAATVLRWPRARFRLHSHGWTATVRTIPRVGRLELADRSQHLADAWRAERVSVTQERPGRVTVTALRTDPLTVPYDVSACPPGTYGEAFTGRLLLGRDDSANWRHLALPGVSGVVLAGTTGSGKTTCAQSWVAQLAGCQHVEGTLLNGKGDPEWEPWAGRFTVLGDDLDAAEDALTAEAAEMRRRHASVRELTGGHVNAWRTGPSAAMSLRLVLLDEAGYFLDATAYKGHRENEARARRLGQLVSALVRRGRSVLYLVILANQVATAEAFGGSALRNNCALSVAFSLRTVDGSVAALGEDIRAWPDVCPTTLQGPQYVGCAVATLRSGLSPYTRLRCPELTGEAATARAVETASKRLDPAAISASLPAVERPALPAPAAS